MLHVCLHIFGCKSSVEHTVDDNFLSSVHVFTTLLIIMYFSVALVSNYSNPGLFRTLLALTRSSQLSLAMASRVCAAAKHKYRRMIWLSIEMNLPLFLYCLAKMLGEK